MDLSLIRQKINLGINLRDLALRVTFYSRVSTEHEEQKKSLLNQNEHFEEFIKQNKNWTYVEGYVDDGISGTSDIKRDSFMRMIDDARRDMFDLIVTKEISRFSRNTLDSIKYTRLLLNYGVAVLFLNDNINTILPDSELRLTIMASMAQDEIRRLSERVKFGMRRAQKNGKILGNNTLFGYTKDKNDCLVVVKEEAKVVREIYDMYLLSDMSLSKISKYLNSHSIFTRKNKKWSSSSLSRLIKNPKYKGYYCGRKVEVINYMTKKIKYFKEREWIVYRDEKIPVIINEEIWARANEKIKSKEKKKTKNTDSNIYNNKIYCSIHNRAFYKRYFLRNKSDYTWICPMYLQHGKTSCNSPNIREKELNVILCDISETFSKEEEIDLLIETYHEVNSTSKTFVEIDDLKGKRERLINLHLNGIITVSELKLRLEDLSKREQDLIKSKKEFHSLNFEEMLRKKVYSSKIDNKIKDLLIDKIIAKKENDSIELTIYINKRGIDRERDYFFNRGITTIKYIVKFIYQSDV